MKELFKLKRAGKDDGIAALERNGKLKWLDTKDTPIPVIVTGRLMIVNVTDDITELDCSSVRKAEGKRAAGPEIIVPSDCVRVMKRKPISP